MRTDKELLDFLDAWANIEIGYDLDDDMRTVHRVTGSINDREWKEIGRGPSLRVALDRAMNAPTSGYPYTEEACPGHVGSTDLKICARCGIHIDSLRPPEAGGE
jgi:hypothetical protein